MSCVFCNIDKSKLENTIIDESDSFVVLPTIGALVDGYLMIISKRHINSMAELEEKERAEYEFLIEKYRNKFKNIYNKFPIVFEHGSPINNSDMKASSVIHAHTHIVNHQFLDESIIIKKLKLNRIDNLNCLSKKQNYYNTLIYTPNAQRDYGRRFHIKNPKGGDNPYWPAVRLAFSIPRQRRFLIA